HPLDPLLGPLQNNGGPAIGALGHILTLQTELLQSGSPGIGRGVVAGAPTADERGFPGVVNGAIDAGATSSGSPAAAPPPRTGAIWEGWHATFDGVVALLLGAGTDHQDG